jgi:SAM-dependent methyltransferase
MPAALFDFEAVFEVEDYLFVYQDELTGERSEAEVATLLRLLAVSAPLKILDLACGFGRHANRLAALGHQVTGVDYIPGFLRLAREEARQMGVRVDYRQEDMLQLDFHEEFDLVLMLFTSFGYFDDADNAQVLANIARALKPGGRLTLDMPNRERLLRDLPPADIIEKGNDLLINRYSFDISSGRLHNRRIIIRAGARKDKPFSIRLYLPDEIEQMLNDAGLVEALLLDEHGQALSVNARRMMVIAHKPLSAPPDHKNLTGILPQCFRRFCN